MIIIITSFSIGVTKENTLKSMRSNFIPTGIQIMNKSNKSKHMSSDLKR